MDQRMQHAVQHTQQALHNSSGSNAVHICEGLLAPAPQHHTSAEDTHVKQSKAASRVGPSKRTVPQAQAAAAPQKPQKLAAQGVGAKSSEEHVYGTILRGAHKLECFKSHLRGEQQLGQLQREQLAAQPLLTSMVALSLLAQEFDQKSTLTFKFSWHNHSAITITTDLSWLGERCGPPNKLTLTSLAEGVVTEEPQPALQAKLAIADIAARVCPQHLHLGIALFLYGYEGSEPVADAAVKLMLAITSSACEQAQQASMPEELRQLVEHSHLFLLASVHSQEHFCTAKFDAMIQRLTVHDWCSAPPLACVAMYDSACQLDMTHVFRYVQTALGVFGRMNECLAASDPAMALLTQCPRLDQLCIITRFCTAISPGVSATKLLHQMCTSHFPAPDGISLSYTLLYGGLPTPAPSSQHLADHSILSSASQTGLVCLSSERQAWLKASIAGLPWQMHRLAVCCTVGIFTEIAQQEQAWSLVQHMLAQLKILLDSIVVQPRSPCNNT